MRRDLEKAAAASILVYCLGCSRPPADRRDHCLGYSRPPADRLADGIIPPIVWQTGSLRRSSGRRDHSLDDLLLRGYSPRLRHPGLFFATHIESLATADYAPIVGIRTRWSRLLIGNDGAESGIAPPA
jgi:hypothetical protein